MSIQINYKNSSLQKISNNLVLFTDENFNISGLKKYILNEEFSYIKDLLKNSDLKKNLLFFEINSKKTIFLVSIKKNLKTSDAENLGAKFHSFIDYEKKNDYFVNPDTINSKIENFIGYFLHGLKLKYFNEKITISKIFKRYFKIFYPSLSVNRRYCVGYSSCQFFRLYDRGWSWVICIFFLYTS